MKIWYSLSGDSSHEKTSAEPGNKVSLALLVVLITFSTSLLESVVRKITNSSSEVETFIQISFHFHAKVAMNEIADP